MPTGREKERERERESEVKSLKRSEGIQGMEVILLELETWESEK